MFLIDSKDFINANIFDKRGVYIKLILHILSPYRRVPYARTMLQCYHESKKYSGVLMSNKKMILKVVENCYSLKKIFNMPIFETYL